MPASVATLAALARWSPVTGATSIPASWQVAIVRADAGRGGSCSCTSPARLSPDSDSDALSRRCAPIRAHPSVCYGDHAGSRGSHGTAELEDAVSVTSGGSSNTTGLEQRLGRALEDCQHPRSWSTMNPPPTAARSSAVSVGSPNDVPEVVSRSRHCTAPARAGVFPRLCPVAGARLAVAKTGRDSGAAAKASLTAVSNISSNSPLLCRPMPIDSAYRPTTLAARY